MNTVHCHDGATRIGTGVRRGGGECAAVRGSGEGQRRGCATPPKRRRGRRWDAGYLREELVLRRRVELLRARGCERRHRRRAHDPLEVRRGRGRGGRAGRVAADRHDGGERLRNNEEATRMPVVAGRGGAGGGARTMPLSRAKARRSFWPCLVSDVTRVVCFILLLREKSAPWTRR